MDRYIEFCEQLWADWLADPLKLNVSAFVREQFDTKAAVEPYIRYGEGARPLVVLLTNPGRPKPHQTPDGIKALMRPIKSEFRYADIARALGIYYLKDLKGAAQRRNQSLLRLAASLGYDGFLAVECCPFHSESLPKKAQLLAAFEDDPRLNEYRTRLRYFLQPEPVVIVSAVSSRESLGKDSPLSEWLAWQAKLAGIDPSRAEFLPLLIKDERTTCAALVDVASRVPKVLIRMMGGNHLPSEENLRPLVRRLGGRG